MSQSITGEGILYYRRHDDWNFVDVSSLVRGLHGSGIDGLPGSATVEFTNGTMRVLIGNWSENRIFVTVIKLQSGSEPPFTASDTETVAWPRSQSPVDNPQPIFSSKGSYAYLERIEAAPDIGLTRSAQATGPGSNLILVLGPPPGARLPLDGLRGQSSPLPAAAPVRGVIGFSGDGRYVGVRQFDWVRVFDVANIDRDLEGLTFRRNRSAEFVRPPTFTWFSPPLGIWASGSNWMFAWTSEPGGRNAFWGPGDSSLPIFAPQSAPCRHDERVSNGV